MTTICLSPSLMRTALAAGLAAVLGACAGSPGMGSMSKPFSQDGLADTVKVPAGHRVALETVGVGEITYECRAKAGAAGTYEWVFVGPRAELQSRTGTRLGTYFGPPATWAANDGSRITGSQVAVAPAGAGHIPLQLVKANPASGPGAMMDVTYIQRVSTQGGVAPASACNESTLARQEIVKYRADYIFWKAA